MSAFALVQDRRSPVGLGFAPALLQAVGVAAGAQTAFAEAESERRLGLVEEWNRQIDSRQVARQQEVPNAFARSERENAFVVGFAVLGVVVGGLALASALRKG